MKINQIVFAVLAGVALLAACENPQLPTDQPDPVADDPVKEKPGPDPEPPALTTTTVYVDFQAETAGVVAEGFAAAGLSPSPVPGQLDADAWRILGFSDGDVDFGEEVTSGDVARGVSPGGETIGGLYAFTVAAEDVAMGVQPTSGDFAPGNLILALPSPSDDLRALELACRFWTFNDQGRATLWSVRYSTDGETWLELPELAHATPAQADAQPEWVAADYSVTIPLESDQVGAGATFSFSWTAEDGEGSGSRDESALDNISITFTHPE